jgi:hypothetical protein
MEKYIIAILIVVLLTTTGVYQVRSNLIEVQNKDTEIQQTIELKPPEPPNTQPPEPEPINPDIQKVQEITNWDLEIATYFVEEANIRNVNIFEEALPLACIETGGTYDFNLVNYNTNGTTDGGLFQLNSITYKEIVKQLKAQGREFDSWDRNDPYVNIAGGIYWIAYLKDKHNLEDEALFTSYNRGVHGAKQYASRSGTYETRYSREVMRIRTELIK